MDGINAPGGAPMYFVVAPDGQEYGPADIPTLRQWAQENRLNPDTILRNTATGATIQAREILEPERVSPPHGPSSGPVTGPMSAPATPGAYYRESGPQVGPKNNDVLFAWILGALALCCCPPLTGGIGIWLANRAKNAGEPNAQAALIFCIVTMVIGLALGVVRGLAIVSQMGHPR